MIGYLEGKGDNHLSNPPQLPPWPHHMAPHGLKLCRSAPHTYSHIHLTCEPHLCKSRLAHTKAQGRPCTKKVCFFEWILGPESMLDSDPLSCVRFCAGSTSVPKQPVCHFFPLSKLTFLKFAVGFFAFVVTFVGRSRSQLFGQNASLFGQNRVGTVTS